MRGLLIAAALLLQVAPARTPPGVITGRLLTVDGVPAADVRVAALAIDFNAATSALVSISRTNGSGVYRLQDVPAGSYLVVAGVLDRPTYFPGVPFETQARPVEVSGGALVDAVDFRMVITPPLRVAGRIVNSGNPSLYLAGRVTLIRGGATLSAEIGRDGKFEFPDVTPGTYQLSIPGGGAIVGGSTVKVTDHDVTGLEVKAVLTSVKIRVSDPAITQVEVRRRESGVGVLELGNADSSFEFQGPQGAYLLTLVSSSPLPLPDIALTLPSSEVASIEIATPRVRRILLRTALEQGGRPPAFILSIAGMVAAGAAGKPSTEGTTLVRTPEMQVIGFSINIVPSPDGTASLLLPEGRYEFGSGSVTGVTAPLRLKSIQRNGVDLTRAPLTVSARDDLEIQIVVKSDR